MRSVHLELEQDLAILTLNQPGTDVNTLTREMLAELAQVVTQLEQTSTVRAAIIKSDKPSGFMAGTNIKELTRFDTPADAEQAARLGQQLFDRLARLDKPVVAALHGHVMGSGLELALACHYRLAADDAKTQVAHPSVTLGLLPALGGTQRLAGLVGVEHALELLLSGRRVDARAAQKMGLVDELATPDTLVARAKRVARALAGEGRARKPPAHPPQVDSSLFEHTLERLSARNQGHYPAPEKIIECLRIGQEEGPARGLEHEARGFAELLFSPQCKALIHLFVAKQACEHPPYLDPPQEVRTIGVLGAGLMGAGIAQLSAQSGYRVVLKDRSPELVDKALTSIAAGLSKQVARGLSEAERERILKAITPAQDSATLGLAELVIEAVPEALGLKQRVLQEVEASAKETLIFASNTSSIPIAQIAEAAARPERVLGMHYFSPVQKMPLLEIVKSSHTSPEVLATAFAVGRAQGKTIIVVADSPGFYTSRILALYLHEALALLEGGATVEQIDHSMKRFGFPVGPLVLFDEIGIDVGVKILDVMQPFLAARGVSLTRSGHSMLEAGYQGRKNQQGFYRYEPGQKNKEVNQASYSFFPGARKAVPDKAVRERLVLSMVNEAVRCWQEGVLASPKDGDVGAVLGLGFPAYTGGPFWWSDQQGAERLVATLSGLEQIHGARFTPAECLREQAKTGTRFYSAQPHGDS